MRPIPTAIALPRWRVEALRVSAAAVWVSGITLVALTLRLFWALYADTYPLGGDPHWYFIVGINVAKGFGFVAPRAGLYEIVGPGEPTAFWPPAYPLVLGAVFKLFGVGVTSAKGMNAVFGAATVPFVYALGAALFDRRAGFLACSLFAVFPNAIAWTPVLFPDELFTLLFVAGLWLVVAPPPALKPWMVAACFGLLAGVALLTRGEGAVLLPAAATYWLARSGWRAAFRSTTVALVAAAATIAPWTVRNAVEMHAFIPVSTNSATVLRIGHAPDSTGYTKWTQDDVNGVPMDRSLFRPDWEVASYRAYPRRAVDYAVTHPEREIELSGLKLYHLYRSDIVLIPWLTTLDSTPFEPAGLEGPLWHVFTDSYYVLFFAAVVSLPFWLRREPRRLLLGSVFLFWSLFHIVFASDPRYHVPLYPLFAIAVAGGAFVAIDQARGGLARLRSQPPALRGEEAH